MITLAVEMNNIGVTLIKVGRFKDAMELFRGSIKIMETAFESGGVVSSASKENPQQEVAQGERRKEYNARRDENVPALSDRCSSLVLQHRQSLISSSSSSSGSMATKLLTRNDQEQEVSLIYHALMITTHDELTLREPLFTELWCAVIIFNSAVAMQEQKLTDGFCKSEMLYRMAYDLAVASDTRIKMNMQAEDTDTELLSARLCLGLLNNLSKLNYDMHNYATARSLSHSLSTFIRAMPRSATATALMAEVRWLLLNCLLHEQNDPQASAAA